MQKKLIGYTGINSKQPYCLNCIGNPNDAFSIYQEYNKQKHTIEYNGIFSHSESSHCVLCNKSIVDFEVKLVEE